MIDHQKLREFAKRGLLVGPKESEEAFLKRCERAQPVSSQKLFSLIPDWISVEYSNKGLLPWQGAVVTTDGITQSVQLRALFGQKKRYLGLYERAEILSHEMVHAVRMAFDEPLFEEILAYRTATTRLRTFLGPLFRSSKDSLLFLLSLPLLLLPWGWLPFLSLLFFFLLRLAKYQGIFTLTLKQLTKLLGDGNQARAFALHLIDKEIIRFSSMSPEKIISYALKKEPDSLRWRQICAFYFSD